jgi:hypothetical protein
MSPPSEPASRCVRALRAFALACGALAAFAFGVFLFGPMEWAMRVPRWSVWAPCAVAIGALLALQRAKAGEAPAGAEKPRSALATLGFALLVVIALLLALFFAEPLSH